MDNQFVSESELTEQRKKRQEEWEKVRQPDEPKEAPEPEYDSRSLFDRLKEQKDKKQLEFDESHSLRNLVKGLDEDDCGFLSMVDKLRDKDEKSKIAEEKKLLSEYQGVEKQILEKEELLRRETLTAVTTTSKRKSTDDATSSRATKQSRILAGAIIKRKGQSESISPTAATNGNPNVRVVGIRPSATVVVGVLPGLTSYGGDSTSDSSCSSDDEPESQSNSNTCSSANSDQRHSHKGSSNHGHKNSCNSG